MNIELFLKHWGIRENPFKAEEARSDDIYERIMDGAIAHPDFEKIYGSPAHSGTSVVFGEKGSGKTAIRLMIENKLSKHNRDSPNEAVWVVLYDDLNPVLDRIQQHTRKKKKDELGEIRLADHMDAILSLITTRLVNFLTGDDLDIPSARKKRARLRRMDRQQRVDLALLAALYDQPRSGDPVTRWNKVIRALRVGRKISLRFLFSMGLAFACLGLLVSLLLVVMSDNALVLGLTAAASGVVSIAALVKWFTEALRIRRLQRQVDKETRVIEWLPGELTRKLGHLSAADLRPLPLPVPNSQDSRFNLFARLHSILSEIGFVKTVVLVDRVDEPSLVNGDPERMRKIVWPLLNNKFLQQEGMGLKLLLPIELGHLLKKEDADFYQKARLDKQNMIERLTWSGSSLYDICTQRLLGCVEAESPVKKLTDLFDEGVTAAELSEALGQMLHPRDAFKFLYRVVQEHCQGSADDGDQWRIPKLALDHVRKQEAQRMHDFHAGYGPG